MYVFPNLNMMPWPWFNGGVRRLCQVQKYKHSSLHSPNKSSCFWLHSSWPRFTLTNRWYFWQLITVQLIMQLVHPERRQRAREAPVRRDWDLCLWSSGARLQSPPVPWVKSGASASESFCSSAPSSHQLTLKVWMKFTACRHSFVLFWCGCGVLSISPSDKFPFHMSLFFFLLLAALHSQTAQYFYLPLF